MRFARLLSLLCVSLLAALPARAEDAGQVLSAIGDVLALRAGRIVRLHAGAPVHSGDQIHTGPESRAEIRFTDWGVVALRPRTDFIVEDYAYEARSGGREKAFFSLLNGGIRSLTGEIGHRDHARYRLRTPSSTIGIRGTHYSVLICRQDCRNPDGSLGEDGLYGSVFDGRIAVSPYGGRALEREFGAGESFRLVNENSIPAPLFSPPPFFPDRIDALARSGGKSPAGMAPITGTLPGGTPAAPDPVSAVTGGLAGTLSSTLPLQPKVTAPLMQQVSNAGGLVITPLTQQVLLPAATLAGSTVNSALSMPGQISPLVGAALNAVPTVLAPVQLIVSTLPPLAVPPVPPITVPPVTVPGLPPVTVPTLPPVSAPTLPPVTVPTLPPVGTPTLPPVTAPTLPPVTAPTLPPVTAPTLPPVTVPTLPPVTAPTLPPVTVPSLPPVSTPTLPGVPLGGIAPLRR